MLAEKWSGTIFGTRTNKLQEYRLQYAVTCSAKSLVVPNVLPFGYSVLAVASYQEQHTNSCDPPSLYNVVRGDGWQWYIYQGRVTRVWSFRVIFACDLHACLT